MEFVETMNWMLDAKLDGFVIINFSSKVFRK